MTAGPREWDTGFAPLRAVAVSPSGRRVVAYGTDDTGDDFLKVWDVESRAEPQVIPVAGSHVVVRFRPSEASLLVASIAGGEASVARFAVDGVSPDHLVFTMSDAAGLAASRDSQTVVLWDERHQATVLETVTRETTNLDVGGLPDEKVTSVEVSALGELLAVTVAGRIKVYGLTRATGHPLAVRLLNDVGFSDVRGLACSGRFVVAASERSVRLVHGEANPHDVYTVDEPIGRIAISANGTMLAVAHGDDHDGTYRGSIALIGLSTGIVLKRWDTTSPVVSLSFRLDDNALVTGYGNGAMRMWPVPAPPTGNGGLRWQPDGTARDDTLQRKYLAGALASWLERLQDGDAASFLVHIDGPWGSGKSMLLSLLRTELTSSAPDRQRWLVVHFNAWRESKVGIPWWALLAALRRDLAHDQKWLGRKWLGRTRLRVTEAAARARWAGAPFFLAFAVLLALAAGFFLLLRPTHLTLASSTGIAQGITTLVAALGTLWAASRLAGRFFMWDSARGAKAYEQSSANPMEDIARHFEWLVATANKPVVFLIDDLDRCSDAYVVQLLEAVQTLIRDRGSDGGQASSRARRARPPCFVVAADGAWIRRSFEAAYSQFTSSVAEAGQPLGYLFLDKLFQLRVPIPEFGAAKRDRYIGQLLLGGASQAGTDEERHGPTEAEILAELREADPKDRDNAAAEAVRKLSSTEVSTATEHWFQQFAVLLPPNPRAIKRFVNNYSVLRAVRILEGNLVDSGTLALWTIIETRWPGLADYLRVHPEAISLVDRPSQPGSSGTDDQQLLNGIPDDLRPLFTDPDLARLAFFHLGGPLTPGLIAQCCGLTLA
jgi:hypothetical protein